MKRFSSLDELRITAQVFFSGAIVNAGHKSLAQAKGLCREKEKPVELWMALRSSRLLHAPKQKSEILRSLIVVRRPDPIPERESTGKKGYLPDFEDVWGKRQES